MKCIRENIEQQVKTHNNIIQHEVCGWYVNSHSREWISKCSNQIEEIQMMKCKLCLFLGLF